MANLSYTYKGVCACTVYFCTVHVHVHEQHISIYMYMYTCSLKSYKIKGITVTTIPMESAAEACQFR